MTGALVVLGSLSASAQATVDTENSYPNVGAIMVWRVDDSGKPVELRGFASGTLIRPRVMITAGHFTRQPRRWVSCHPRFACSRASVQRMHGIPHVDSGDRPGHAPVDAALPAAAAMRSDRRNPGRSTRTRHCRRRTVFLERAPANIQPAVLAAPGTLERSEGARTTIVGYGLTSPGRALGVAVDAWPWDGQRRIRASAVRRIVDETWGLWSIPSYVCSGDSGGGIFLTARSSRTAEQLVANVSDGGQDCRRHNNNNRLDTRAIQTWIDDTLKANWEK